LRVAQTGHDIASLARELVSGGRSIVVAAGGDGTVSTIAAELAGTGTSLGVLPLGPLNHFAKDVGIPLDLEEAVDTVVRGRTVQVDVGEVNGHTFVNNSSLGLYPLIVEERSKHQARGYAKWVAFARSAYEVMRRVPRFSVTIEADGRFRASDRTPFVFVGNSAMKPRVCALENASELIQVNCLSAERQMQGARG
jgi:diacylglycerol kinase family enzyme